MGERSVTWPGATAARRAAWALVGATIDRVIVDVSGEAYLDLEKEAIAMMKRD